MRLPLVVAVALVHGALEDRYRLMATYSLIEFSKMLQEFEERKKNYDQKKSQ
jgi:hypothetical protein